MLAEDSSSIDNVHQVSLKTKTEILTLPEEPRDIIVHIELMDSKIEGSPAEPFALALPRNGVLLF